MPIVNLTILNYIKIIIKIKKKIAISRARTGDMTRKRLKKPRDNDVINVTILGMVIINPHINQRQISHKLNVSPVTVNRILRANHHHPYHISIHQQLLDNDKVFRVRYCRWALDQIYRNPTFFHQVMFSDEAIFENNGGINRHNSHILKTTLTGHVDNQHRWKVNVWCGILHSHIIRPYFFMAML